MIARLAGRTYVHSQVAEIITSTYALLEVEHPDKVYKYGETGLESGGEFKPHKTHQNGLSVDFFVPVISGAGDSVHLPTHPLNRFGYDIEFDEAGRFEDYQIDFVAMAAHIVMLHRESVARGFDLWRVIFDPALQDYLFETEYGEYLRAHVEFSKKPSWVRHDEHYHVDFSIPCATGP